MSMYKVSIHRTNGYRYASTQPARCDEKTGKKVHFHIHWGVVDENLKFYPGKNYFYADIEERSKLVFPHDWDLSELNRLYGQNTVNIVHIDGMGIAKRRKHREPNTEVYEEVEEEILTAEKEEKEISIEKGF